MTKKNKSGRPVTYKVSDADLRGLSRYPALMAEAAEIRRKFIRRYSFQTFYRTLSSMKRKG